MDYVRGALSSQELRELIKSGVFGVQYSADVETNIQPAGYDPVFEDYCYRVPNNFRPMPGMSVEELLQRLRTSDKKKYDVSKGLEIKPGFKWLLPLAGKYSLQEGSWIQSSKKSTQTRLGNIVKLISDNNPEYDEVWGPFNGKLYVIIEPKVFYTIIYPNTTLIQLRVFKGSAIPQLTAEELSKEISKHDIAMINGTPIISHSSKLLGGITLTADIKGEKKNGIIGFKAKNTPEPIDMTKIRNLEVEEYYEELKAQEDGVLKIEPEEKLYLLSSREMIRVPPHLSATIQEGEFYDGELKTGEKGFFDPGFGYGEHGEIEGSTALLKIPPKIMGAYQIFHGEKISRLTFEWLTKTPDKIYGENIGSTYHKQTNAWHTKQFKNQNEKNPQEQKILSGKKVLVIRKTLLQEHYHQGFKPARESASEILKNAELKGREEANKDMSTKQLSVYTVILNPLTRKFFLYKRAKEPTIGKEQRLKGKWSIGMGGRILEEDLKHENPPKRAAQRKILETINITGEVNIRHAGFINDDRTDEGQSYYGLLFIAEVSTDSVQPKEELKGEGEMVQFSDFQGIAQDPRNKLEEWSQIAFSAIKQYVL